MATMVNPAAGRLTKGPRKQAGGGRLEAGGNETPVKGEAKSIDAGTYDLLPIAAVVPSPLNARKVFDQAELNGLAATIREAGIVQPLIVRRADVNGKVLYELVAGERRHRAATIAGLTHVPCVIRQLDDRQAMLARALENYQRKELNAIEEASEFSMLCSPVEQGGAGYSQHGLAAELGCTQGHIANRIRLLSLPEAWRARVISGEISAGAAREILRATGTPELAKRFEKSIDERDDWDGPLVTVEQWKEEVDNFLRCDLEPMEGKRSSHVTYCQVSIFTPTDEERKKLGIVTVTVDGKEEERATNTELWEKLQRKHEAALDDKKEAKKEKASKAPEKKLSPAEVKRKEKERGEEIAKRLEIFRIDWLRLLIARRLPGQHTAMTRLVLYAIAGGSVAGPAWDCREGFSQLFARATPGHKRKERFGYDPWEDIRGCSERKLSELSRDFVVSWFVDAEGEPMQCVPDRVVEDLAAELSIDLREEWQVHKAGTLTERYWNLHDKAGLEKLCQELDVFVKPSATKSQIVKQLLGQGQLKLPKELAGKQAGGDRPQATGKKKS